MDIIKQSSKNIRIHFFRNMEQPDWFFVKDFSDKRAETFYLCSRHLPPHEDSGYEDLPVEWAFALETDDVRVDDFLNFIRYQKGIKQGNPEDPKVKWIGANGWYEFRNIENRDKWLNDFYEFQNKQLQKINNNGKQIAMF
jgi:hypothetical protein